MLDYAIRLHSQYPNLEIYQVVIYLTKSRLRLAKIDKFKLKNTEHRFHVIRLWEIPYENLLQSPGLLPFAVLS